MTLVALTCAECGVGFELEAGPGTSPRTLCSDACRSARRNRRQRDYARRLREEAAARRGGAPRPRALRQHDTHPDRIVCATVGCRKLLTVAAVNGGSEHCSRDHAGYPALTESERGEREPTPADLAEVGTA